jgi:hypothetical protein
MKDTCFRVFIDLFGSHFERGQLANKDWNVWYSSGDLNEFYCVFGFD